jgi:hypothetical protein
MALRYSLNTRAIPKKKKKKKEKKKKKLIMKSKNKLMKVPPSSLRGNVKRINLCSSHPQQNQAIHQHVHQQIRRPLLSIQPIPHQKTTPHSTHTFM